MQRKNYRLIASLLCSAALGCNEQYESDPNADAVPVVTDVVLRDAVAFDGSADLSGDESGALTRSLDPSGDDTVFPFQYPTVLFNKLLNGDSIETLVTDPASGRPQSLCEAQPGIVSFAPRAQILPSAYRTCYNPSTRSMTVQGAAEVVDGEPQGVAWFLQYGAFYQLRLSDRIKDKANRSLTVYSASFHVGPFEVYSVTAGDNSGILYGTEAAGLEAAAEIPENTGSLRLVFTGPMHSQDVIDALNANAILEELTLADDGSVDTRTPVTAMDDMDQPVSPQWAFQSADMLDRSADPRVLFLDHPAFTLDEGAGFSAGTYELTLPVTITDDGSVTGTPVPLLQPFVLRFTVVAPE